MFKAGKRQAVERQRKVPLQGFAFENRAYLWRLWLARDFDDREKALQASTISDTAATSHR